MNNSLVNTGVIDMKATTLAIALAVIASPALATNNGTTNNNGNAINNEVSQTANLNAASLAAAKASTASAATAGGSTSGANVGNTSVTNDTTTYFAPPAVAPDLPSGANAELAPQGWSGGISTLFGGVSFGHSEQLPTPTAGATLISYAVEAEMWATEPMEPSKQAHAKATARFLCGYYAAMVSSDTCDKLD